MTKEFYKSLKTPVLRRAYMTLRDLLSSKPVEERRPEDLERLLAMRDELDRRVGKPSRDVDFEKYLTD